MARDEIGKQMEALLRAKAEENGAAQEVARAALAPLIDQVSEKMRTNVKASIARTKGKSGNDNA